MGIYHSYNEVDPYVLPTHGHVIIKGSCAIEGLEKEEIHKDMCH